MNNTITIYEGGNERDFLLLKPHLITHEQYYYNLPSPFRRDRPTATPPGRPGTRTRSPLTRRLGTRSRTAG